ncbi:ATPase, P-type, K/Mg/Cd/Cu/Zn/Na/Ca/Na/H-transporter, partial [mine drainage metagenome]
NEIEGLHKIYGYNEIPTQKENKFLIWLKQFWGPLPWLLELVAILSFYSGDKIEGLIIIILLVINAFISLLQRSKTDTALATLKRSLQINARVLRDNEWKIIATRDLVPGDLVRLRAGDIVSADMHLIGGNVSVDQSSLTGESLPVELDNNGTLYSGSYFS